jgi:protein phosphatase PTC7
MKVLKRLNFLNNHIGANHNIWKQNVYGRAFSTKKDEVLTKNRFKAGVYINPHYAKRHKGGEDAACLSENMLSVADGVGGWAESGIDPAIYSKRLCQLMDTLY